jgi:hypothetical protein
MAGRLTLAEQAIDCFGIDNQIRKAAEECSECSAALLKILDISAEEQKMSLSARPLVRSRTLKSVSNNSKKSSIPTRSRKQNIRKKAAFLTRYAEPEITESVQGVEMFLPVRLPGFNEAIAASKTGRGRF